MYYDYMQPTMLAEKRFAGTLPRGPSGNVAPLALALLAGAPGAQSWFGYVAVCMMTDYTMGGKHVEQVGSLRDKMQRASNRQTNKQGERMKQVTHQIKNEARKCANKQCITTITAVAAA